MVKDFEVVYIYFGFWGVFNIGYQEKKLQVLKKIKKKSSRAK